LDHESNSSFLQHEPCPDCGSQDNLARYDDGHGYCFGCGRWEPGEGAAKPREDDTLQSEFIQSEPRYIKSRGLSEETCKKFAYGVGEYNGSFCHVANYRDADGKIVAQKIRMPGKDFRMIGKPTALYGEHLWRDGGRFITVTEGEIDALSVSQAFGNKWPVVSIPTGAKGAAKAIARSIEFLEKFDAVHLCFDSDEPGRAAAAECALLLTPGKAKIVSLPCKDANECLVEGKVKELVNAVYGAKTYRPDGVVCGEDLFERVMTDRTVESVPYPWDGMNDLAHGIRQGELVTLCSGTGVGKSSVCRELAYWLMGSGKKVGYIALEESVEKTARAMMGLYLNCPPHYWDFPEEKLKEAFDHSIGENRLVLYDHFGSMAWENLVSKIRYMVLHLGATHIFLDHLSIIVSGIGEGDERRMIDQAMTKLRSITEELGIALLLVSHLRRPEGRGHEEGAQTSLAQLRGSHAIGQLSDIVVGLERNQQDEDDPNITTLRILKNRFSGETGCATRVFYDKHTGRLSERAVSQDSSEDLASIPF